MTATEFHYKRVAKEQLMKAGSRKLAVRAGAVKWATACFFFCQAAPVLPQALFYQGKIVTVISGQEPGGTGDMRLKALLPYLKKHIPGQPNLLDRKSVV